jgi:hypothetical protein
MLTTAVSVLAAIALLLPGFIIVELSAARGARSSRSDLELALRALTYALIVHLAFFAWTVSLVQRIDAPGAWDDHVEALVVYSVVVLVAVPIALGVMANIAIAKVERRDGPASLWAAALGAGEARDAYDFMWQRASRDGTWVIVELIGHTAAEPRLVGGLYGRQSAVGQTPAAHDLYLQQLCIVREREDGLRELTSATDPPRGVWLPAGQIARIEIVPAATTGAEMASNPAGTMQR